MLVIALRSLESLESLVLTMFGNSALEIAERTHFDVVGTLKHIAAMGDSVAKERAGAAQRAYERNVTRSLQQRNTAQAARVQSLASRLPRLSDA